jgi:hypothetical protein
VVKNGQHEEGNHNHQEQANATDSVSSYDSGCSLCRRNAFRLRRKRPVAPRSQPSSVDRERVMHFE